MKDISILIPKSVNPTLELPDPELVSIYKDKENRVIWMLGEIGEECFEWVSQILEYNREDADIAIEKRKPIKCIIANYGGSLENARMLAEIISLSKTPVYGYAIGMCASAASVVYLACHKRFATKNVTILLHNGSCDGINGNYNEVQQFMDNYKKEIKELSTFYKTHTKFDAEEIDRKLNGGDWYIYLEEGLEKGLIDDIINDITMFF